MTNVIAADSSDHYDSADQTRARWGAAAMAGVILIWCVPALVMVAIVPKFEVIFRDFGVPLPGTTVWLINASHWLLGHQVGQSIPGLLFAAPVFLLVLGAAMVLVVRERSWGVLLGLILLPILFIAVTVYAMFVPLVAMIESLQGGGAV